MIKSVRKKQRGKLTLSCSKKGASRVEPRRMLWVITGGEERAGDLGGDVEKPQSTNKGLMIGNS